MAPGAVRKPVDWTGRTAGRNYRILALVAASLILALTLCACGNAGSGTIVSEERPLDGVDRLFVRGEGTVFLMQGDNASVVVETDDNLISKVYTKVKDGTLELSYASGPFGTHLRPTQGYIYHVTIPDPKEITIKGSAVLFADGLVADKLDLELIGSGQIDMADLRADDVEVLITGSGEITLSGEAGTQKVSLTGSGTFDGTDFAGQSVTVSNKGSGTVTVWATEELAASIAGEGDVFYYGDVVPDLTYGAGGEVVSLGNR